MVIAITAFDEKILLGKDLRINIIATDDRGKMLNTVDASLFSLLYSVKHSPLKYFSSVSYSSKKCRLCGTDKIKATKCN